MRAAFFVGRVGGLAVALGVGAAVFNGVGVASADSGAPDSGARGATANDSSSSATAAPARTRRDAGSGAAVAAKSANKRAAASGAVNAASVAAPAPKRAAAEVAVTPEVATEDAASGSDYVADSVSDGAADSVVEIVTSSSEPDVAPTDSELSGVIMYAANGGSDGAGDGSLPVDSPLAWSALAVARRNGAVVANHATAAATAATTAAATVTSGGITVDTATAFVDGIFRGTLTATSAGGNTLTYSVQGSSCGDSCGVGTSGGKMTALTATGTTQNYVILPYANWLDGGTAGSQSFGVKVSEVTQFDKFLTSIPLVGLIASPIISLLQTTPFVGNLLAPLIGSSVVATLTVDTTTAGTTPLAYTYKVTSFDGVLISTNFFPASGLAAGGTAPTVLNGPGLGGAGNTNPDSTNQTAGSTPGIALLRNAPGGPGDVAYNVVTWDPRGEFQSGGILQLDNPFYEGRDVSALIDWVASDTPATLNGSGDPALGMVGGSYGGGIQLATVDPRIDAVVPAINWNSLNESLYPDNVFKTAWANTLALSLLTSGARVNNQVYLGIITGDLFGFISETAQAVLGSSGPTALLNQLQAPTLLVQGTVDALFPLVQSIENAQDILANPYGTPTKMIWFCGGHGICLDPVDLTAQATTIFTYDKAWLNKYVSGVPIPDAFTPNFQWWDQTGTRYTSDLYPFDPNFNQPDPLVGTSAGGTLGILPFAIGGSGPNTANCAVAAGCSFPLNQVFATPAGNAINVPITGITTGQQVVGAPTVSFTYSGLGTSKAVYGQIVDNATGRVLGNIVTEIPVILDGQTRTVSVPLADIAYTAGTSPSLTLQITSSATLYWNSSWGVVNISGVTADLPVRA